MSNSVGVEIRPYTLEDAPAVWEAVRESLSELRPWMPWCHDQYSIEESHRWLEVQVPAFRDGSAFSFAIVGTDGQYLGGCGLNQVDEINKRANLGYWVRSSVTRRGVATTAVGLLRDWAFRHTDFVRLEVVIAAGNLASQRVARKAGAEFEGTLRKRLCLYGIAHDATMFSFTRAEPSHGDVAV
jgi:ribosomal-protein-serine acetyltransferase